MCSYLDIKMHQSLKLTTYQSMSESILMSVAQHCLQVCVCAFIFPLLLFREFKLTANRDADSPARTVSFRQCSFKAPQGFVIS